MTNNVIYFLNITYLYLITRNHNNKLRVQVITGPSSMDDGRRERQAYRHDTVTTGVNGLSYLVFIGF